MGTSCSDSGFMAGFALGFGLGFSALGLGFFSIVFFGRLLTSGSAETTTAFFTAFAFAFGFGGATGASSSPLELTSNTSTAGTSAGLIAEHIK